MKQTKNIRFIPVYTPHNQTTSSENKKTHTRVVWGFLFLNYFFKFIFAQSIK